MAAGIFGFRHQLDRSDPEIAAARRCHDPVSSSGAESPDRENPAKRAGRQESRQRGGKNQIRKITKGDYAWPSRGFL